jgi:hypothetical protein
MTTIDPDVVPLAPPLPDDLVMPEIPLKERQGLASMPINRAAVIDGLIAARMLKMYLRTSEEAKVLAEIVRAAPLPNATAMPSANLQLQVAKQLAGTIAGIPTPPVRLSIQTAVARARGWYDFLQQRFDTLNANPAISCDLRGQANTSRPAGNPPRTNLRVDAKCRIAWLDAKRPTFAKLGRQVNGKGPAAGLVTILGYRSRVAGKLTDIATDGVRDKTKFTIEYFVSGDNFADWVPHTDVHRRLEEEFGFLTPAEAAASPGEWQGAIP